MGHQVYFRVADADVRSLEEFLLRHGAIFVPRRWPTAAVTAQETLEPFRGSLDDPVILRASDRDRAQRYFVVDQGYWLIDSTSCPILDWMRGKLEGRPSSAGRLYYPSPGQQSGSVSDPSFDRWAAAILRWIRREFRYDSESRTYIGPEAARLLGPRT